LAGPQLSLWNQRLGCGSVELEKISSNFCFCFFKFFLKHFNFSKPAGPPNLKIFLKTK
jgi:hypothetical protein